MSEGYRQVRRSATTIGLAISMGAALLLLNQNDAAAVDSVPSKSTIANIPSLGADERESVQPQATNQPSSLSYVKLAAGAIEHEVKQGESLWQLAQEYRLAPEVIAATNKLSAQANLLVGQTLTIPSLEEPQSATKARPIAKVTAPEPLNRSLSKLRESRQRLQESLAQLQFEESEHKLQSDFAKVSSPVASNSRSAELLTAEEKSTVIPKVTALSLNSQKVNLEGTNSPPTLEEQKESQRDRPTAIVISSSDSLATPQPLDANNSESIDRPIPLAVSIPESSDTSSKEFRQPELPTLERTLPDDEAKNAASIAERVYRVKPGDTINKIAQRYEIPVSELIRANQIKNPNVIKVSQQLTIPTRETAKKTVANTSTASRPNPSIPVVTASLTPVSLGTANSVESSTETTNNSHTQKLIADIDRLQRDYPDRSRPISISGQAVNRPTPASEASIDPEWNGDRQTIQFQGTAQSRIPGARFVRTPVNSNDRNQAHLVGAAPADAQQYNDMIKVPVGETVGPELPALSAPDDYLPDTPMKFTGYIWPAKGVLTSGYGWRWGRMHKGVDIAAPIGTPVVAAAAGEVISAGWNSGGFGNLVKLRHADGSETLYGHNSRILVRPGQVVEQGELISEMGSTGYSTGPHLHFEVHPNGQGAVNPIAYLPKERS